MKSHYSMIVFCIFCNVISAEDGFFETFNGDGEYSSITKRNDFDGRLVGQVHHGLDEPGWFIDNAGEGQVVSGFGYAFDVNATERNDLFVYSERAEITREVAIENSGSFVERVSFQDFRLLDDDTPSTAASVGVRHILADPGDRLQIGLIENVDLGPFEEPIDTWTLSVIYGDQSDIMEVEPGSNIGLGVILLNDLDSPIVEFTYDRNLEDLTPPQRFGPFAYDRSISTLHETSFRMSSWGPNSIAAGAFDTWAMQDLEEFENGDFDYDGFVGATDIDILNSDIRLNRNSALRDLTDDGIVNEQDRDRLVTEIKKTFFGDSNLDREFNSQDLVLVFEAGEYEDEIPENSTWTAGDWNGDTEFDSLGPSIRVSRRWLRSRSSQCRPNRAGAKSWRFANHSFEPFCSPSKEKRRHRPDSRQLGNTGKNLLIAKPLTA